MTTDDQGQSDVDAARSESTGSGSSGSGSAAELQPTPAGATAPQHARSADDPEARWRSSATTSATLPAQPPAGPPAQAATANTTGAGAATAQPRAVSPEPTREQGPPQGWGATAASGATREQRPLDRPAPRAARPVGTRAVGRPRRARLVVQRVDPWSVFLFSLVASICLGIVLLVAVATLYFVLSNFGVLSSVNTLLAEVLSDAGPESAAEPVVTAGRVLGATAVLAAVDVVLLTVLATLSALLYNLCASLTGGIEVMLGERD